MTKLVRVAAEGFAFICLVVLAIIVLAMAGEVLQWIFSWA